MQRVQRRTTPAPAFPGRRAAPRLLSPRRYTAVELSLSSRTPRFLLTNVLRTCCPWRDSDRGTSGPCAKAATAATDSICLLTPDYAPIDQDEQDVSELNEKGKEGRDRAGRNDAGAGCAMVGPMARREREWGKVCYAMAQRTITPGPRARIAPSGGAV
jgi:hypothetical protein